jgi:hypothetical protein
MRRTVQEVDALDTALLPCLAHAAAASSTPGYLSSPLPALDDAEGARVPRALPPVVDAHIHVFPDALFAAIWRWFDEYGWPIRYKLRAPAVIEHLLSRGIERLVLLHYAHKPGIARGLNKFVAELASAHPGTLGTATVFPGEPHAVEILEAGFALGLRGLKLHCHVQCIAPDDPELEPIYRACVEHDQPVVIHAGREPKSPGYRCDPHALCSAERVAAVLESYPGLRLCVPHLGADEFDAFARLLARHDNLWLDTTMAVAGYFPGPVPADLVRLRPERVMYGTDFPNIPFAWDRELKRLLGMGLSEPDLAAVLGGSATDFFSL